MSPALKLSCTKKTFISSSRHRSKVELHTDFLVYRLDEKFSSRKVYYKEIYKAKMVRINHLFYFLALVFLALQGLTYFVLVNEASPLYPILTFFLFLLFLVGIIINGKCLFCVRIKRMGIESEVFLTSKASEARRVVKAINTTLSQQEK